MLKTYCRSCGAPTEYTINKPKICCQCGISFASIPNITPTAPVTPLSQKITTKPLPVKKIKAIYKIKSSETPQESNDEELIENDLDLNEDNEETVDYVPEIDKLEVEITGNRASGVKLGSIIGTSTSKPIIASIPIGEIRKINKKEVLEQFRRDAGKSSRTNIESND